ncbi:hypothetical protein CHLNCDRAFT_50471 [Chlorella variabilis]|uniref:EamA domain-containing protein n=1 Tax=Chlorella variabilis TaxID=554065 RepID=E1Z6G9_CHLVA|nr:hypothetical protein CHLNCDRAFT_50471 [Chlorella variabilis]EFN58928.1 hypothetical protein CHLNCDRAFT_50471 [Chlorella variabilis]|eukprot:XP_005851030.1 hypothetical protein CHLNCDRAFT_50471 [Chlorella variabilis]
MSAHAPAIGALASPRLPTPRSRRDRGARRSPGHGRSVGAQVACARGFSRLAAQEAPTVSVASPRQQQEDGQRPPRQRWQEHQDSPPPPAGASMAGAAAPLEQQLEAASQAPAAPAAAPAAVAAPEPWLSPKLALLVAAMLWGSYSVSVRLLYSAAEPPDAVVVMAVRGMLQAAAMLAVSTVLVPQGQQRQQQQQEWQQQGAAGEHPQRQGAAWLLQQFLTLKSPPLWMAAVELGLWNFTATGLQTLGLQLTSATRASFLIQATVMLTPLLSTLAGYRPGPRVWGACGLALAGTLLVTADEAGATAAASGWGAAGLQLGGDGAILAAALFYSLGVVRITGYAQSLSPSEIATSKSFVLGGLALASLVAATGSAAAQGLPAQSLWGGVGSDPLMWAALLWSGLGPGALASYLHARASTAAAGQKHVTPAEASVVFSSKPLWAAGLAWLLLGGEELGPLTWVGGATLMSAGLLSTAEKPAAAEQQSTEPQPQPVLAEPQQRRR